MAAASFSGASTARGKRGLAYELVGPLVEPWHLPRVQLVGVERHFAADVLLKRLFPVLLVAILHIPFKGTRECGEA